MFTFVTLTCLTLMILAPIAIVATWFYWPRLSHMRAMQNPVTKAETELSLMRQTLGIERQRTEIELLRLKTIKKDEAIFDASMGMLHQNHVAMLPAPQTDTTPMPQTVDPLPLLLRALHIMLIGFSDGGKTTLLHYLATAWAQSQRVMVLDFDFANGMWPGCEVFTESRVAEFCRILATEFESRQQLRQSGERTKFDPWRIIIDEYSAVASNKEVTSIIELLLRRGRKYGLNVVVGIQDNQVKSLGWEGKGALRTNFTYTVEAKVNSVTRQRTLTLIPNEGEPISCLTPDLPNPEQAIKPVPRDESPVPAAVPVSSQNVPVPNVERYKGTDKEIATAIINGKSKTWTRENVTGRNEVIGQRYDEIKAELYPPAEQPILWFAVDAKGGTHE